MCLGLSPAWARLGEAVSDDKGSFNQMGAIFEAVYAANQPQAHRDHHHPLHLESFIC